MTPAALATLAAAELRPWREPWEFSDFICELLKPGSAARSFVRTMYEVYDSVAAWGALAPYTRAWLEATAPDGIWCARGLNGLHVADHADVEGLVFSELRDPQESFSLNLARAVSTFAVPPHWSNRHYQDTSLALAAADAPAEGIDYAATSWVRAATALLERKGERVTKTSLRKAMRRTYQGVVVVARIQAADVANLGGDSESGFLNEAELKVTACDPRCVEGVYICSQERLPFDRATAEERRRYALDEHVLLKVKRDPDDYFWYFPIDVVVHPRARCQAPTVVRSRRVRHLPAGFTWYAA